LDSARSKSFFNHVASRPFALRHLPLQARRYYGMITEKIFDSRYRNRILNFLKEMN
jgi:hypothetical protein